MTPSRMPCTLADLGMANALGSTLDEIWPRLVAGDQTRFTVRDDLVPGQSVLLGQVQDELPEIPTAWSRYDCRNNRIALAALEALRPSVASAITRFGPGRVGIVVGSSTAGIAEAEQALRERHRRGRLPASFDLVQLEFGGVSEFLALASGAAGPCYTLSNACASGAKALVAARTLLELDVCDAVISGAVDSLCRLTANGFFALQAVAKGLTNPMSCNREGLTLGEGAALFLLTRDAGGIQLLGAGESSDAHHMSAPDPSGRGAETSMRAALSDASLAASDVAYLNLHATGTRQNDSMEGAAVQRVFGGSLPCSSTKPLVGHTLGAAGAIEAGFCWLMLTRRANGVLALPPHRWDHEPDPELPILDLVRDGATVDARGPLALISNSFGFGGSNCTLAIGDPRT